MNYNKPAITGVFLLLCFIAGGVWLTNIYIEREKQRDVESWDSKLALIAESQKRAIEAWLEIQFNNLDELASNPLLQIFLTLNLTQTGDLDESRRGQLEHLKNLVSATARRADVFDDDSALLTNQTNEIGEGVGITDHNGRLLLATQQFPPTEPAVMQAVEHSMRQQGNIVYGIYENPRREPRLILAVPVSTVQADRQGDYPGAIVAVINPANSLYKILAQHWLTTESDESLLVTGDEFSTQFISPLKGKFKVFHGVSSSNTGLAENFARQRTGDFSQKTDYRGDEVLVTARNIYNTDWTLVQKIDVKEALKESSEHQEFLFTIFMLAVFITALSYVAIWRHATSVRLQKTMMSLSAHTALLNSVGNNISDHIFLLDADNNIAFANESLAHAVGTSVEDIRQRSLNHIFSADVSGQLLALREGADGGLVRNQVMSITLMQQPFTYHVSLALLQAGDYSGAMLYVLHDITMLKRAQEKHNRLLEGIISVLVHAVDLHDPYCANHSERTREVAVTIAQSLAMDANAIATLAMAALLANLGKLNLPRSLLTKMEPLSDAEQMQMHSSVLVTVDILKDLEFDGPVIEIIKQKNEYLDGSGYPAGLHGDQIMKASRILAVANAFVAMSSARAYRQGMPVHQVLDTLLQQTDSRYDRQVVAALFHAAENHTDWRRWQLTIQI